MSRSGYSYDHDEWSMIRWRGAVKSALRGKRGQAFLREMRDALDAMPEKALIADELVAPDGQVCALGAVCVARGVDVSGLDPEWPEEVAGALGLAPAMVAEITFENDEKYWHDDTPEKRWKRMREWVDRHLIVEESDG